MNRTYVARAPGKLFLLGEYAVLDGGPSIVAAIDRHVEVRVTPHRSSSLTRIAAPGHFEVVEVRRGNGTSAPGEVRLALTAIETAMQTSPELAELGFDVEIRNRLEEGADSGQKLGLGASAAVTVALVAALRTVAGGDVAAARDEIFATAFAAHRRAQGGVGSGADVAASTYGGVLLFEPKPESLPAVRALMLPPRTQLAAAWSGRASATAPLVRSYLALDGECAVAAGRSARRDFVRESRASVDAFVGALDGGWLSSRSVSDNGEALERLGRRAGLDLLTPALERLVDLARAAGAGAKLSGAGGGDCAIALSDDAEVAERVRAAWRAASFAPLRLGVEPEGVSVAKS